MSDVSKYNVWLILFPFYFAICHPHFDKQKLVFPREALLHSFYKQVWVCIFWWSIIVHAVWFWRSATSPGCWSIFFCFFLDSCRTSAPQHLTSRNPWIFFVVVVTVVFLRFSEWRWLFTTLWKGPPLHSTLKLFIAYPPSHKCRGTIFFVCFVEKKSRFHFNVFYTFLCCFMDMIAFSCI